MELNIEYLSHTWKIIVEYMIPVECDSPHSLEIASYCSREYPHLITPFIGKKDWLPALVRSNNLSIIRKLNWKCTKKDGCIVKYLTEDNSPEIFDSIFKYQSSYDNGYNPCKHMEAALVACCEVDHKIVCGYAGEYPHVDKILLDKLIDKMDVKVNDRLESKFLLKCAEVHGIRKTLDYVGNYGVNFNRVINNLCAELIKNIDVLTLDEIELFLKYVCQESRYYGTEGYDGLLADERVRSIIRSDPEKYLAMAKDGCGMIKYDFIKIVLDIAYVRIQ